MTLGVMSDYLYPIIVAASAITTFSTPYLIKFADPFTNYLGRITPSSVAQTFASYTSWIQDLQTQKEESVIRKAIKQSLLSIGINLSIIIAVFIIGSYLAHAVSLNLPFIPDPHIEDAAIWCAALLTSMPFLLAIYIKLKGLSILLAETAIKPDESGEYNMQQRRTLSSMVPVLAMQGIVLMIIALSASILPPLDLLVFVLVVVTIVALLLWRWFIKLHHRLQMSFIEKFNKK